MVQVEVGGWEGWEEREGLGGGIGGLDKEEGDASGGEGMKRGEGVGVVAVRQGGLLLMVAGLVGRMVMMSILREMSCGMDGEGGKGII